MDMDKKAIAFVKDYIFYNILNKSEIKMSKVNLDIVNEYIGPERCRYDVKSDLNNDLYFKVIYYVKEEEWHLDVLKRIDDTALLDCDVEDLTRIMMDNAK